MEAGGLREAVERVRKLVRKSRQTLEDGTRLQVTFSGGAVMAAEGDSDTGIVQRADALLYRSKADGRNRVTFEDDAA